MKVRMGKWLLSRLTRQWTASDGEYVRQEKKAPRFLPTGSAVKRLSGLVAGNLVILGICLFLLESAARIRKHFRHPQPSTRLQRFDYTAPDDTLGYRHIPAVSGYCTQQVGNDTIYHIAVSTDSLGRRTTLSSADSLPPFYAIFLGCSFTFGHSVSDHETLPSLFSARQPAFQSYNYGVQGYGTQQLPFVLDRIERAADIPQDDGFLVYTFIDNHVNRVIGDKQAIWFTHTTPYFEWEAGEPVYKGSFDKSRPMTTAWYRLLGNSVFLQSFPFNLPLKTGADHYRLTAALIRSVAERYRRKFGNDRFYVLIYPGESNRIVSYLDPEIQMIDLSDAWPQKQWKVDGHPDTRAYSALADMLADSLRSKGVSGL